jgi:hypothetical protein
MSELGDIRAAIAEARTRFLAALADFPDIVLETEPSVGAWSSRDVTGHIADWQSEMLSAARAILGEPKPRWHPIKNGQGYNTAQAALRGTDSWQATRSDFEQIFAQTDAFLDTLDDEKLTAIGPYPWGEVGRLQGLMRDMASHLNEHAEQLETWRLQRTGVRVDRGHDQG